MPPSRYGWDLAILRAGARLLLEHRPLYDAGEQARVHAEAMQPWLARFPFAYPPIAAIEVAPLARLPNLVALALLGLSGALAVAWVAKKTTGSAWPALAVTASFPGLAAFFAGQVVWLALGVFGATYLLLKRERPLAAGLVASLLAFKPTLLVMVPVALAVRPSRLRALAGLALGVAVQLAVSLFVAPAATRAYPHAAAAFSAYVASHPALFDSVTFRGSFGSAPAGAVAIGACAIAACAWMWRSRDDLEMVMATCVLATLACAWHCLPYDYSLVALAFFWLGRRLESRTLALGAAALVLLSWSIIVFPNRLDALALYPPVLVAFSIWLLSRTKKIPS